MKFSDILKTELPAAERLLGQLSQYAYTETELQGLPAELRSRISKLKIVPPITSSGLEKVHSITRLVAAAYVVGKRLLNEEITKPPPPSSLPKR